jgi:hypothetical protein
LRRHPLLLLRILQQVDKALGEAGRASRLIKLNGQFDTVLVSIAAPHFVLQREPRKAADLIAQFVADLPSRRLEVN